MEDNEPRITSITRGENGPPADLAAELRILANEMDAAEKYLAKKYGPAILREYQLSGDESNLLRAAADEIERLRNILEKIAAAWERTPREGESHLENAGQIESIIDSTLGELRNRGNSAAETTCIDDKDEVYGRRMADVDEVVAQVVAQDPYGQIEGQVKQFEIFGTKGSGDYRGDSLSEYYTGMASGLRMALQILDLKRYEGT